MPLARLIRGGPRALTRLGDRSWPQHVNVNVGIVVVALVVVGFTQGVLFNRSVSATNSEYSLAAAKRARVDHRVAKRAAERNGEAKRRVVST